MSFTFMDPRICLAALGSNWKQVGDKTVAFKIYDKMPKVDEYPDHHGLSTSIKSTLLIQSKFDDPLLGNIYSVDAGTCEETDQSECKYPILNQKLNEISIRYNEYHNTSLCFYRSIISKRPLPISKENMPLRVKKPKQDFDSFLNALM